MRKNNKGTKAKDSKKKYETPEIEKIKISNTYKLSITWPEEATMSPSCPGEPD